MENTKLSQLRVELDEILNKINQKDTTTKVRKAFEKDLDKKRRELEDYLENNTFDSSEEVTFYPELLDKDFNSKILRKK